MGLPGRFWDGRGNLVCILAFLAWSRYRRLPVAWLSFGVAGVIEGRSQRDTINLENLFQLSWFLIWLEDARICRVDLVYLSLTHRQRQTPVMIKKHTMQRLSCLHPFARSQPNLIYPIPRPDPP